MEKDDKILKKYFEEDFADASVNDGMEDAIMNKIELIKSRQEKPLVSKTVRFIFLGLAIIMPVAFLILALNGSASSDYEMDWNLSSWSASDMINILSEHPVIPIVGVILIYIAADTLWRLRKKSSHS